MQNEQNTEQLFLTVRQVAERFGISIKTVRRRLLRKDLCVVRVGRSLRIPRAAVEIFESRRSE